MVGKYAFNFNKMFINAFLIGLSNPKGIIGFPLLLLSFIGPDDLSLSLFKAFIAALGAVLSATCWWILFYFSFKIFDIRKKPFVLKKIIELLSLGLILLGISRLF